MKRFVIVGTVLFALTAHVREAAGQATWQGGYVGGAAGGMLRNGGSAETVRFDTNLDGTFNDVVRTVAGVDAFGPGFCAGPALSARAADGCARDDDGPDFGGRLGYDWQRGRIVFGGLVELSRPELSDAVTAFSTTPAFYTFTREAKHVAALRGRVGMGLGPLLAYGTGGPAWGDVEQTFRTSNAVNTFVATESDDTSAMVWGYQAGAGAEYRLGAGWTLVGEYLFTRLDNRDDSTIRAQGPAPATNPFILVNAAGTALRRTEQLSLHGLRAGINYRF